MALKNMELRDLHALIAIAETGSLSAAAQFHVFRGHSAVIRSDVRYLHQFNL